MALSASNITDISETTKSQNVETESPEVQTEPKQSINSHSDIKSNKSLEETKPRETSQMMIKKILEGLGTHKLDLTFPYIPPDKAVPMYMQSVQNERSLLDFPKYKEEIDVTACLARLRAERELVLMEKWLSDCRKTSVGRRAYMDLQWDDLNAKEEELRAAFKKFNNFVKENEEKRDRSIHRIEYLKEIEALRNQEINELHENYDFAQDIKSLMERKIKEYSMYEDFLNETANASKGEFRMASDFIIRYEALLEAKSLIKEKHETASKALQQAIIAMRKQEEEATLKLIGLRNHAGQLLERCEKAKFKSLKWESIVGLIYDHSVHTKEEMVRTKDACWDIYTNLSKRKDVPVEFEEGDVRPQLVFMKKTMDELQFIMGILTKIRKKEEEF